MATVLIAYYSRKGENYWDGQIVSLAKGNTEIIAAMIQKQSAGICLKLIQLSRTQRIIQPVPR